MDRAGSVSLRIGVGFASTHGHVHIYYEARVCHELSLTHLALSNCYRADPTTREAELEKAAAANEEAKAGTGRQSSINRIRYKDVPLGWESSLAWSEILAESSDWDGAHAAAARVISAHAKPPAHILARAWIARAKTYLGQVKTLDHGDISGRIERFKEMTQGTLIRKLCTYTQPNPTRRAIFEFDKLIRSIYTLRYLRDPQLQRKIHRS